MEKNKEKIIVVKNLTVKYGLKQQPITKSFSNAQIMSNKDNR